MTQLDWNPGIDFEVDGYKPGPYRWKMFLRDKLLDDGTARTRIGLELALQRRSIMFRLGIGKPAAIVRSMQ